MARYNRKFDDHTLIQVLLVNKGNIAQSARALRVSRACVQNRVGANPKIRAMVDRLRETNVDMAEKGLQDLVAKGNVAAIIFTLKTLGRDRGYVERVENISSGEIKTVVQLPEDWPGA